MIKLRIKNYNMILIKKLQRHQPDHQTTKLASMNTLQVEKYWLLKKKKIEQVKFTYSPSGKAFKKQTKTIEAQVIKQIYALNTLKLKQLEAIEDSKSDDYKKP